MAILRGGSCAWCPGKEKKVTKWVAIRLWAAHHSQNPTRLMLYALIKEAWICVSSSALGTIMSREGALRHKDAAYTACMEFYMLSCKSRECNLPSRFNAGYTDWYQPQILQYLYNMDSTQTRQCAAMIGSSEP